MALSGPQRDDPAGRVIAALLTRAWRADAPANSADADDLTPIAALCVSLGAAPLAWWTLRSSSLATQPVASQFHDAFRLSSLQAVRQRTSLIDLVTLLRNHGIDPIVVKGWAIAR